MRSHALGWLAVIVLAAVALRLGVGDWLPNTCPLRLLTGIPCAACGMTRAATALCHGDFAQATAFNLASIPLALLLAVWMNLLAWEAIANRPVVRPVWRRCGKVVIGLLVALMLAAWAVNIYRHFRC
jgi:Protein of unknown function (DUF2752)